MWLQMRTVLMYMLRNLAGMILPESTAGANLEGALLNGMYAAGANLMALIYQEQLFQHKSCRSKSQRCKSTGALFFRTNLSHASMIRTSDGSCSMEADLKSVNMSGALADQMVERRSSVKSIYIDGTLRNDDCVILKTQKYTKKTNNSFRLEHR